MRFSLFLLFCLSVNAGAAPLVVDWYMDWENGSIGDLIDLTYLAADLRTTGPAGSWTQGGTPDTPNLKIASAAGRTTLSVPVSVGGSEFTDTASKCYDYNHQLDGPPERWKYHSWAIYRDTLSFGCFFKSSLPTNDNTGYDLFEFTTESGADWYILQWFDGNIRLHTAEPFVGANIPVSQNTWYWVTGRYVPGGTSRLAVYSLPGWTLIGESTLAQTNLQARAVRFGCQPHGASPTGAHTQLDCFVIDWTTATYPLGVVNNAITVGTLNIGP